MLDKLLKRQRIMYDEIYSNSFKNEIKESKPG